MCKKLKKGFSLLEIMMALLVLATSLVVLLQNHSASLRLSGVSRHIIIGTQLARMKMAEIELKAENNDLSVGTESGDFGDEYPGYRWEYEVAEETIEILDETLAMVIGSEYEITGLKIYLNVYWKDGDTEEVFPLQNFILTQSSQVEQTELKDIK